MFAAILIAVTFGGAVLVRAGDSDPCCLCGPKIRVTLRIENDKVLPYFNHSIVIKSGQRELVFFLQEAADRKKEFKFSADYGQWGYFINTMNGLKTDYFGNGTWWKIRDGWNSMLNKGVSSYVPSDKEIIIFSFEQGGGH